MSKIKQKTRTTTTTRFKDSDRERPVTKAGLVVSTLFLCAAGAMSFFLEEMNWPQVIIFAGMSAMGFAGFSSLLAGSAKFKLGPMVFTGAVAVFFSMVYLLLQKIPAADTTSAIYTLASQLI